MDLKKLKNFVENSRESIIDLQRLLTSIPALAPENGGQGEVKKCEALQNWLSAKGFKNLERFDAKDTRVESGIRPNLIATIPGKSDDFTIWVMAHLDVVPPGELSLWQTNPWEMTVDGDILFGRGVEDNQQGLVSGVFAALSFLHNKEKPAHTVKLLFMADEEVGSTYGAVWLLKNTNLFRKQDIILIPDGGDTKGETIEVAEKNMLWLKFRVSGKQTHGSRPDQGVNACLAANELSLEIHNLQKVFDKKDCLFEPDYSTFQPTMKFSNVEGINIIPGEDIFFMDCRILPCYPLSEVIKKIEECCKNIENKRKVKIEFSCVQKNESPATAEDSPVVQKLSAAIKETHGLTPRLIGVGGGTVGAEFRKCGYNAAVWSTLENCAHTPNEYCKISNLIKDAKTLIALMAKE